MAKNYQIVKHGIEYPDYWQGYGPYGTGFARSSTGSGYTEKEALGVALDMMVDDVDLDWLKVPNNPKGISSKPVPKRYGEDAQWYVTILYNVPGS